MIRGIVVLALLGVALASRSANLYIDNVIRTSLPNELQSLGLFPASLPSFNVPFGYQGTQQSVTQANFINGNATGFAHVKRNSECQGPRVVNGELIISCVLSLYPITTNYLVRIASNGRVYNVRNMGHVAETLVSVVIAGRPLNFVGSVKQLQIQKVGLITPTFEALPQTFLKYVKTLEDAYKANVSTYLYNIIQNGFLKALGRAMARKPMPRQ